MTEPIDAPKVRFPPPFVFLGFLLLSLLLERLLALPGLGLGLGLGWPLRAGLGGALALGGIALAAVAFGLFRRSGENPEPWTPSQTIVDTGIYARTRNPMYLGMALAYLGFAVIADSLVALVLLPVVVTIIQVGVIAREEAYLERRFGAPYAEYRRRVRRWL